jgi:hypothetical protein
MTAPSPHGYPDWGRYAASADKKLDTQVWADMDVQTTFGPYFVGDIEWVNINFTVTAQNYLVRMQFREDIAAGTDLHNQEFVVRSTSTSYLSFPVTGPWLSIRVTPSAANSTGGFTLTSAKRGGNPINADSSPNILKALVNNAVGAGATVTSDVPNTVPGPAIWNVFPTPATWVATVESLDEAGAATRLDTIDNTVGKGSRFLYLPYEPIRVAVQNTSGAPGTFNLTVMAAPLWPMVG